MAVREAYDFGDFTLDAGERLLSRNGESIALPPKAFDVLLALIRNAGRLASKRELLDSVWPDATVEEGILAVHISTLRKALHDEAREHRYIETVSRIGYRFVAAVKRVSKNDTAAQHSIAVLPARPLLGEIFSDRDRYSGLAFTDSLIDQLGRYPHILVRPTRAIRAYLRAPDDPLAIARSLRAEAVIEILFVATADRIQVTVRLIRAHDGATLWTGDFDQPAAGLLAIAGLAAQSIAPQLGPTSTPPRATTTAARPEVYELCGRGRFHLLSYSIFEVPKAVDAFRAAIALDSAYAPAHAGLALAHCAQAGLRLAPPTDAYRDARASALHALALDDSSADAQLALGAVLFFAEWNWDAAERALQRALQLNPNHSEAFLIYGQLLDALGRLDAGLTLKLRALERDPFSPLVHLQISMSYWNQRRFDDAIEWANKTLALDPRHSHAREHLAGAWWKKGDCDRYIAENLEHARLHNAPPEVLARIEQAYSAGGILGVVKLGLDFAAAHPQAVPPMQLALLHGQLGNMDAAFEKLDCAIEAHDPGLVHLAVAPQWDCLRADARFPEALCRMKLNSAPAPRHSGSSPARSGPDAPVA
jgi:DNA-binding winged helix-turn-helix (wHTH) protein/tetratricopeptide (TPR) repeat protein